VKIYSQFISPLFV